ncbi:MAG TPA: hypothetical protein ENI11_04735 [Actinobacteria bacterium]|nr:hypothetical protein [Actinomycetota bacterium]
MKRFFVLVLILTIGLILVPAQFALAAPCGGGCGDEATCGGTACADNECPCDTGGTCICIDNKCQCAAPCNDEKGCSSDCPTKDSCRPAVASADIGDQDTGADQEDGTSEVNEEIKDTDDSDNDDGDESGTDVDDSEDDEGVAEEAADVDNSDGEDDQSSTLLYAAIALLGAGTIGGGFLIFGRKKKDENES